MNGKRFKRYGTGILYIVGNGKVIHFDSDKIKEMHELIHEREKDPEVLYGLSKKNDGAS